MKNFFLTLCVEKNNFNLIQIIQKNIDLLLNFLIKYYKMWNI